MLRGHVFIVDENTLPIHLEYQFVGTSSGEKDNNISLLADMLRVNKAVDNEVYHITGNDARQPGLPKKLIYRKKIKPYEVYQKGVLEWVLWTLIYRKMKGHRGNTMLFHWEVEKLISLIRDENNGISLSGQNFTFNKNRFEITSGTQTYNHNIGKPIQISLKEINSETAFQAYILQNISPIKNKGSNIVWIGNEVFAGSGIN